MNEQQLKEHRINLIKGIIVAGASFALTARETKRKDNGEPPFGLADSDSYHRAQSNTLASVRRSFKSFSNGSTQVAWTYPNTQSIAAFLQPNKFVKELIKQISTAIIQPTMSKQSNSTSKRGGGAPPFSVGSPPFSVGSNEGPPHGDKFICNGPTDHIHFEGKLEDLPKFSDEELAYVFEHAKEFHFGQNLALLGSWLVLLPKIKTPDNLYNVQAVDWTIFNVDALQAKLYKAGFDGSYLFLQAPSTDDVTLGSVDKVVAHVQQATTRIYESDRIDGYRQLMEHQKDNAGKIKTLVYIAKAPDGYTFDNTSTLFQKDNVKPGDLSRIVTLIPKYLPNKYGPKEEKVAEAVEKLIETGDSLIPLYNTEDEAMDELFYGAACAVSWQVPLNCQKVQIGRDTDLAESSDDDFASQMANINLAEAASSVQQSFLKTPPRGSKSEEDVSEDDGDNRCTANNHENKAKDGRREDHGDDTGTANSVHSSDKDDAEDSFDNDDTQTNANLDSIIKEGNDVVKNGYSMLGTNGTDSMPKTYFNGEARTDPKSPAKMIQQAKYSRNEMKSATEKKARKKVVDAKRKSKESGD